MNPTPPTPPPEDEWLVWIIGQEIAPTADVMTVMARSSDKTPSLESLGAFLVEQGLLTTEQREAGLASFAERREKEARRLKDERERAAWDNPAARRAMEDSLRHHLENPPPDE